MRIPAAASQTLARSQIDQRSLLVLLGVYLKEDVRTGSTISRLHTKDHVSFNKALIGVVGVHLFMGATLSLIPLTAGLDVYSFSILLLTYTLLIVAMAVVVESGNTMFGTTEAEVLGHLPITPRTYLAAKLLNLFLFSMLLAGSLNLFPMISGIWAADSSLLFPLAHALSFTAAAMFATALVVVCYGMLIRYVSKERFDSIIGYLQIGLLLSVMFGYQILPRVLELDKNWLSGFHRYHLLYPPAWFSGLSMIALGRVGTGFLALAALSVLSLCALGLVAMRKIATGYASFSSERDSQSRVKQAAAEPAAVDARNRGQSLWSSLAGAILKNPVERAVFDLLLTYIRRNRETKLRTYPSMAYLVFVPFLAILSGQLHDPFAETFDAFYSIMGAAMISFGGLSAVESLVFSDHYPASYIFRVAPITSVAEIHRGFRKVVCAVVTIPGYLFLLILYGAIWKSPWHAFLLLAPWAFVSLVISYVPFVLRPRLPLSRKYQKGQQSARVLSVVFGCLVVVMIIGGLQFAAIRGFLFLPYWLFGLGVSLASIGLYALFNKFSRELMPVPPIDQLASAFGGGPDVRPD